MTDQRYLVTIRVDGDPCRTQDYSVRARSAYHAGWLYRHLNPKAKLTAIRLAPAYQQDTNP